MDGGWSIKRLHRAIMLSSTYQQSCEAAPETFKADPDNRLFGRMNRRRLDAESIRDSLLVASGTLDARLHGPSTRDPKSRRRSLYLMTIRSDNTGFGPLFDVADSTALVDIRTVSTVAPQALYLAQQPVRPRPGEGPGRSASRATTTRRIDQAYATALRPSAHGTERAIGRECLAEFASGGRGRDAAWESYCHTLLCTNEWIYTD